MRKLFSFIIAATLLFSTLTVAYAATLPNSVIENGDTYLRTFNTKDLTADQQNYFESVMTSKRSVLAYLGNGAYSFFIVPDGCTVSIFKSSSGGDFVDIGLSPSSPSLSFRVLEFSSFKVDKLHNLVSDTLNVRSLTNVKYIAGGNFWSDVSYKFPALGYNYIAEITGKLIIEWNTQGSSGDNWWNGLLEWISSFWDKFISTIKGLFVPSPDYFQNFFNEIRTAFDKKLGGLSDLLGSLSDMFSSLKGTSKESSLFINVPDNQFFSGYKGVSIDVFKFITPLMSFVRGVLNLVLIVFTILICYKKLVDTIRG